MILVAVHWATSSCYGLQYLILLLGLVRLLFAVAADAVTVAAAYNMHSLQEQRSNCNLLTRKVAKLSLVLFVSSLPFPKGFFSRQ
jgi:hypothetical protein